MDITVLPPKWETICNYCYPDYQSWYATTTSSNESDAQQREESIYKFTYNFGNKEPFTKVLWPEEEDTGKSQEETLTRTKPTAPSWNHVLTDPGNGEPQK